MAETGQPLRQHGALDLEGRQPERPREVQVLVAQEREGEVQPLGGLPLVFRALRAQAEDARPEPVELIVVVAEGARLGCAAAGAGDPVPAFREIPARPAHHRVAVHDRQARKRREVDPPAIRGSQRGLRQASSL